MSDAKMPKRWSVGNYDGYMVEWDGGDYVEAEDVEPLLTEITRLRAENIHLRRAGMNRPSAELHEAALAELRADNERLRARVEVLERACRLIEADPDPNAVVECVACYRHSRLAYHALEAKP